VIHIITSIYSETGRTVTSIMTSITVRQVELW